MFYIFTLLLATVYGVPDEVPCGKILTNINHFKDTFNPRFGLKNGYVPAGYTFACDESNIIHALNYAKNNSLTCVIRTNEGNSYIGQSTTNGGLVIDISQMTQFEVNSNNLSVRVGAGMRLLEVYSRLYYYSENLRLGLPAGSCPGVAVGGLAQGGGHGLSSAEYGITSDNILSAKVIVYDSERKQFKSVIASPNEHIDLYKAIRGGMGGNYGVVTEFTFQSYPVNKVIIFVMKKIGLGSSTIDEIYYKLIQFQLAVRNLQGKIYTIFKLLSGDNFNFEGQCFCQGNSDCSECNSLITDLSMLVFNTSCNGGDSGWLDKCVREEQSFGEAMWTWAGCSDFDGNDFYPGDDIPTELNLNIGLNKCYSWDKKTNGVPYKGKSIYLPAIINKERLTLLYESISLNPICHPDSPGHPSVPCIIQFDLYDGKMLDSPTNCPFSKCDSFDHRQHSWHSQILIFWNDALDDRETDLSIEWANDTWNKIAPLSLNTSYQNYIDNDLTDWSKYYYSESTFKDLQKTKCKYNKVNMFNRDPAMSIPYPKDCNM